MALRKSLKILGSYKLFQIEFLFIFKIISRIRYYLVHIPHLINQSGSGITLDSVTEFLSKRSLYSFDTSIVVTRPVSLQIPFSRPIRKRQAKTPRLCLTHNQRYLLVLTRRISDKRSPRRTHILLHSFHRTSQSSKGRRFWLNLPPFHCTQTPPVSQRRRGQIRTSRRINFAVY